MVKAFTFWKLHFNFVCLHFFALTLISCTPKKIQGPDGRMFYATKCRDTMTACYKKATKTCDNGYVTIEQIENNTVDDRQRKAERAADSLQNLGNQGGNRQTVNINTEPAQVTYRKEYTFYYDCK